MSEINFLSNQEETELPVPLIDPNLNKFLVDWDQSYKNSLKEIALFDPKRTSQWSDEQKQFFVRVLYHIRGHFSDFLWYMGNFAPNYETKQMIINNIRDEFGMNGLSHEKLYHIFAESLGVDLSGELLDESYYLPFARQYIEGQLRWLRKNDWDYRVVGFSAIERLDNADYVNLKNIAVSIGVPEKCLVFFNVHINANHFDSVLETSLMKIWMENSDIVREIFYFIHDFQIQMFSNLSKAVFNFCVT